jgi:hypothetical protein
MTSKHSDLFKNPKEMSDKQLVVTLEALQKRKRKLDKQLLAVDIENSHRQILANRECQKCGSKHFSRRYWFKREPTGGKMERLFCADCGHVSTYGEYEENIKVD